MRNHFIVFGFSLLILLTLSGSASALITKDYNAASQTIWINNSGSPIVKFHLVSTVSDLTFFQEVLEVTPYISYTLTSGDLNRIYTQYKGTNGISSSTIEIYNNGWQPFNIVGFNTVSGTTYTLRLTFHKQAETGAFSILTGFGFFGVNINELTWFNGSWTYKTPILINNTGNATTLTNFSINLNVTYNSNMIINFSDLRVVNDTAGTTVSYWIESQVNGSYANLWFNASSIPASVWTNNTYYLYYGNPSATSLSNISNTFLFGDDFSNDLSKWTVTGTAVIDNGKLKISGANAWNTNGVVSVYTASKPFVLEYTHIENTAGYGATGITTGGFPEFAGSVGVWGRFADTLGYVVIRDIANSEYTGTYIANTEYNAKIVNRADGHDYYRDSTLLVNSAVVTTANKIAANQYTGGTFLYLDNVRIRNYVPIEPTAQLGAQTSSPFYINGWGNNFTNDQQTTFSYNLNQIIKFNATTNTTTTSFGWLLDGVNQSWNFDNFNTTLSVGTHTITATFYNSSVGFWANKSWFVTLQMVLTSPANGSTTYYNYPPLTKSVNHSWTSAGYPYYNIQISSDPNFNVLLLDTYTSNSYYVQSMGAGSKYWRIRNYDQTTLTYGSFTPWFNYTLVANVSTPSGNAGIIGVVYELISGNQTPISGATVYIQSSAGNWSSQMTTGSNGYYRFDNLTNNTVYYVYSTKKDYQNSVTEYVTTGFGTWITRDILMKPTEPTFFEPDKQYVKFKARWLYCFWNCDIQGAMITVYKSGDVVATYSGLTDSTGTAKFLLFKTQLYRVTVTNASAGINQEMKVYGSETDYVFLVTNQPTTWNDHTIPESQGINISVSKATINNTHAYINVSYSETVGTTSALSIYINQTNGSSAQIVIASGSYGSAGSHSYQIMNYSGQGYLVHVVAAQSEYGTIDRTYAVQFDKINGMNAYGIPEAIWLWFAVAIMFFTGAMFTASTAEKGFVIVCAEGWIFLAVGMFSTINVLQFGIGLTIASIIAIFAYIRVSQAQAGYT